MKELCVVVTMDCEPTTATSDPVGTGPASFADGEKAVRGYAAVAAHYGFPITCFIHPETALGQPEVFENLQRNHGACLGLHMHPWKYSKWKYDGRRFMAHYGALSEEDQYSLMSESVALWRHALGRHPLYFRPGTHSANDSVYRVLANLGFRGGSVSNPGRVFPDLQAVWTGAEPDPHRGHPYFRQLQGDLDFANMPVTGDLSETIARPDPFGRGKLMHRDLRPDWDWDLDYRTIAGRMLDQMRQRQPDVWCFNLTSHNHFDYTDPDQPSCKRLHAVLGAIHAICKEVGVKPAGATIETICDRVLELPKSKPKMILR